MASPETEPASMDLDADEVRHLERLRASLADALQRGSDAIEQARARVLDELQAAVDRLRQKADAARARSVDFLDEHRDEIIALLVTAGKIALVVGIRRLTAAERGDGAKADARTRGVRATVRILSAISLEVGRLIAASPSSLPLLRERYAKGDAGEQAVIAMVLGPSLRADPRHALDVIAEFLAGSKDPESADAIARRSLAPLLGEHPELVPKVQEWLSQAAPYVRRGAVVALSRVMEDRRSVLGDAVAAAVVLLEDHDEEARSALGWLLESAARLDPKATALALTSRKRGPGAQGGDAGLQMVLHELSPEVRAKLEREMTQAG